MQKKDANFFKPKSVELIKSLNIKMLKLKYSHSFSAFTDD
jgi:hypothetical protein